MFVLDGAILDASKRVVEFLGPRTRLVAEVVTLARVHIVQIGNGRDDSRRATSPRLLEGFKLVLGDGPALHFHAEILRYPHETFVSDGGQDGGRFRRDISVVLDAKEVGRTTFVDVFFFF